MFYEDIMVSLPFFSIIWRNFWSVFWQRKHNYRGSTTPMLPTRACTVKFFNLVIYTSKPKKYLATKTTSVVDRILVVFCYLVQRTVGLEQCPEWTHSSQFSYNIVLLQLISKYWMNGDLSMSIWKVISPNWSIGATYGPETWGIVRFAHIKVRMSWKSGS